MPINNTDNSLGVVDKRLSISSAVSPISATTHNAMKDDAAADTQLATLNGAYYTAARLQTLNENDKKFALRTGYDNAGI
jgi:hypothetical protein